MGLRKPDIAAQVEDADAKNSVRFVTDGDSLAAYTRIGNVITANANGALPAQDGVTPVAGDSTLLDFAAPNVDSGVYKVSQLGSGGAPFVLTRRDDFDQDSNVTPGIRIPIEEGTAFGGEKAKLTTTGAIVVNTTPIDFELEVGGGGGFELTVLDGGRRETIPEGRSMLTQGRLRSIDGGVHVKGRVHPVGKKRRFAPQSIAPRETVTIPAGELMYCPGGLEIHPGGILDIKPGAVLATFGEETGASLLVKLGDVLPEDFFLVGGGSPASGRSPAAARDVLDVYSKAEADALLGMATSTDPPYDAPFTTVPETIHQWIGNNAPSTDLPASPTNGMRVAYIEQAGLSVVPLVINGNGHSILSAGTGQNPTITVFGAGVFVFLRYSAVMGLWIAEAGDLAILAGVVGPQAIYHTAPSGPAATPIAVQSLIARVAGNVEGLPVPANAWVGRQGGSLGANAVGPNQIVLRAAGNLGPVAVGLGQAVGRTTSGDLAAYDANALAGQFQPLSPAAPTITLHVPAGAAASAVVTLGAAGPYTFNFVGVQQGNGGRIVVKQDVVGGRTIAAYQLNGGGGVIFPGGVAPVLSAAPNAVDVLEWFYDGGNVFVRLVANAWS